MYPSYRKICSTARAASVAFVSFGAVVAKISSLNSALSCNGTTASPGGGIARGRELITSTLNGERQAIGFAP